MSHNELSILVHEEAERRDVIKDDFTRGQILTRDVGHQPVEKPEKENTLSLNYSKNIPYLQYRACHNGSKPKTTVLRGLPVIVTHSVKEHFLGISYLGTPVPPMSLSSIMTV